MSTQRDEKIRQLNDVLAKWRGAQAQFWSYTATLATLEIRLFFTGRPEQLLLVCSPCVSVSGPVYWEKCELTVGDGSSEDDVFVVQDQRASVRVLCRQLYSSETVEPLSIVPQPEATASVTTP